MKAFTSREEIDLFNNKKVAVIGAGISNRPLISFLAKAGAHCTVFDKRELSEFIEFREQCRAKAYDIAWSTGENYLEQLHGFDMIFRSPAVRPDLPEIREEAKRGATLSSEMEVFFALCPCDIIAITGSDGKTTTTTLIHRLLEAAGIRTHLGGNIGRPLLADIHQIKKQDIAVVELSSFQLLTMTQSPQTAVMTNISPNHLDIHKDYQEYKSAKANILRHQNIFDRLVLNGNCNELSDYALEAKAPVFWTERRPFGDRPLFGIEGNEIFFQKSAEEAKKILMYREDLLMPGRYNALNVLSALAAVADRVDIYDPALLQVLKDFKGVEHRTEFIRELNGVKYYNSSIDSSPQRSLNSLSAFKERAIPVVMIAGGKDKKCDYQGLGRQIVSSCKAVYLVGQNSALIRAQIEEESNREELDKLVIQECHDYQEAVHLAKNIAVDGDAVLLSPAGTSFDAFNNFMERGEFFKKLVKQL